MTGDAMTQLIRIERGDARPEEVAALAAVLCARTRGAAQETGTQGGTAGGRAARWRRLERVNGYQLSSSWRTAP